MKGPGDFTVKDAAGKPQNKENERGLQEVQGRKGPDEVTVADEDKQNVGHGFRDHQNAEQRHKARSDHHRKIKEKTQKNEQAGVAEAFHFSLLPGPEDEKETEQGKGHVAQETEGVAALCSPAVLWQQNQDNA